MMYDFYVTLKVYCDACLIPRNVLKSYISTFSLEVELLACVTEHSQRISSDLRDTSGNFFDILHTQILVVIMSIRVLIIKKWCSNWTSVACHVRKGVL